MDVVSYSLKFLTLMEEVPDLKDHYHIEDCGNSSPSLKGYHLCFPKNRMEDLIKFHVSLGANREHFLKMFEKEPVRVISFPALSEGRKFTTCLIERFDGDLSELLRYYNLEVPEHLKFDSTDELDVMDAFDDFSEEPETVEEKEEEREEDVDKEVSATVESETVEENGKEIIEEDGEEEMFQNESEEVEDIKNEEDINISEISREAKEELEIVENEISRSAIPEDSDSETYTMVEANTEDTLSSFREMVNLLPEFKEDFTKLVNIMFGERAELLYDTPPMSEEEFMEFLELTNSLDSTQVHKAFKVILMRLWRSKNKDIVTKTVNEFIYYLEEDSL